MRGRVIRLAWAEWLTRCAGLVSSGRLNIKPLVTHRFELERAIDAFNVAGDYKSGAIKTQIVD